IVALGISTEGIKIPLGLWEGSTENATVATALLSDLVERGLDPEQGILFVIDGAKALRKAIRNVFGEAPVQRCLRHKERNVLEHLPERERPAVKQRLRRTLARASCIHADGTLEADRQFRMYICYRDLSTLVVAIEHDHDRRHHAVYAARSSTKEAAIVAAI